MTPATKEWMGLMLATTFGDVAALAGVIVKTQRATNQTNF
jgi:hypothetical protein